MQDTTTGWARYIEDLEARAARLPRRHRPARAPGVFTTIGAAIGTTIRAAAARLAARLRPGRRHRSDQPSPDQPSPDRPEPDRPEIDG